MNRHQRDFVAVLRVQLRKIRQLRHARRAPRRPEVDDRHFSLLRRQRKFAAVFAVQRNREIRALHPDFVANRRVVFLFGQQRLYQPFENLQRHRPDLVVHDFPVRIDDHRHRQLRRAAQRLNHRARLVQRERHVKILLREELVHIVRHEVRVNRHQRDFVAVLRVQLRKIRQLRHARRAPRRPEVDDRHFSLLRRQREFAAFFPVQRNREVRALHPDFVANRRVVFRRCCGFGRKRFRRGGLTCRLGCGIILVYLPHHHA